METRAHHVLIGLFTLIAVAAALLFAFWLGRSSEGDYKEYVVLFNETVNGLSQGSPVQYSGIRIGDVEDLGLDPHDPRRVVAHIRVRADTPIKRDTRARLSIAGVTGASRIQLSSGTPESPELVGEKGQPPVIVADPSPISQLMANGEDLLTGVSQALANVNRMLSAENAERISRTLDNLQQATGVIADQRDEIRMAVGQLAKVSQQASGTLEQTTALLRNVNGLVDDQGRSILQRADHTMASLQESSLRLDKILQTNSDSLANGLQGLGELGPAIRELRDTLASLRQVTHGLNENPVRYLMGRENAEEFEP
ncbi:MlaD family protein [Pseudomonas sp. RIT-PI-AD]|uniref:MlaD family protein n=1 Tax=Pseudomonas sp. RIT-PI-AD TaxID=3035294 RepID=UPI0021D7E573|nr:MlaD family protein [Pseudomonas sp. RIT-PI-AD]